jgi:Carboxypeptidase regulatory-like domain
MEGRGMSKRFLILLILTFCICAIAPSARAQSVASGTIHGTVTDATNATLPGVTATLTSPALQVAQVLVVTDQEGNYRFTDLPAGTYRVTFELPGFSTLIRQGLRLTVGFVARVDVTLQVGGIEQAVTVNGQSPVVDATTTSPSVTLTKEVLDSVPRGRNLEDVFVMTPGVTTQGAPDVGDSNLASRQNIQNFGVGNIPKLQIEGINVTDSGGQSSGSYVSAFAFEEVMIKTSGTDAEVSTPGIEMVAILKSGGNEFHGQYQGSFETPGLQSNNRTAKLLAQGVSFTNPLKSYADGAVDLGGRIIRDKTWFYLAWNRQSQTTGLLGFAAGPGPDGKYGTADDVPGQFTSSLRSATMKLSHQLTKNNRLIGVWQKDLKRQPQNLASRFVPLEDTRNYHNPINIYKGELQSTISDQLLLNVVAGYGGYFADYRTDYGRPGNPSRLEGRYQVDDSLSFFPKSFLGGHHELKAGTTFYWEADGLGKLSNPQGNYLLYYDNGVPYQMDIYNYPIQPHDRATTQATYLKDTWRIGKSVTLNLGVRWERQHTYLPAQSIGASAQFPTLFPAAAFPALDVLTWVRTVPRAGVAWNLDTKTVVKSTFGIYNSAIGDQYADGYNKNAQVTATFKWTDPTHANDYVPGTVDLNLNGPDFINIAGAANNIPNQHLRQPITKEATASVERELMENLGFRALYVFQHQKDSFDLTGWNVLRPLSAYDTPITRQDPGPDGVLGTADDGAPVTFHDYNATYRGAAFVGNERLNNPNNNWFHSMEFTLTKRASERWSAIASYWVIKNHRWITNTFDNPNIFFPLDETWSYATTVSGSYRLPGDVQVSGLLQSKTGVRGQRTYTFRSADPSGGPAIKQLNTVTLALEPFGAQKGPALNVLDLRASKRLSLGSGRLVEVEFDVFNILNSSAPTAITFTSGPTFGYFSSVLPPRVARFGAKFSF